MSEPTFEQVCKLSWNQRDGITAWADLADQEKEDWRSDVAIVVKAVELISASGGGEA